jgi:hypothetical protein
MDDPREVEGMRLIKFIFGFLAGLRYVSARPENIAKGALTIAQLQKTINRHLLTLCQSWCQVGRGNETDKALPKANGNHAPEGTFLKAAPQNKAGIVPYVSWWVCVIGGSISTDHQGNRRTQRRE